MHNKHKANKQDGASSCSGDVVRLEQSSSVVEARIPNVSYGEYVNFVDTFAAV